MVVQRREIASLLEKLNNQVMKYHLTRTWDLHPRVHSGLNAHYIEIRQELGGVDLAFRESRHKRLRKQLVKKFEEEDQELRQVDLAYTNTQP